MAIALNLAIRIRWRNGTWIPSWLGGLPRGQPHRPSALRHRQLHSPGEVPRGSTQLLPWANWESLLTSTFQAGVYGANRCRDGQGDFDSSSQGLAEGERLQLEAVVRMSKEWVFIKPANDSGYFSSLHVANQFIPAVDDAIRIAHTASNPAWQHGQINGNLLGSLFRSLEHFLRGVGGCLLMDNGDTACWQINPMARGRLD